MDKYMCDKNSDYHVRFSGYPTVIAMINRFDFMSQVDSFNQIKIFDVNRVHLLGSSGRYIRLIME